MLDFVFNSHDFHTVITAPAHLSQNQIRSFLCGTCCLQNQKIVFRGKKKKKKDARKEQRKVSNLHFHMPRQFCGSISLGNKAWEKQLTVGSLL